MILMRQPEGRDLPPRPLDTPWLTVAERARLGAMRRPEDAAASLLAGFLLATLAAEALGQALSDIQLGREPSGRPMITIPRQPEVDLNASHAGGWVAAAIGKGRIGVDLEAERAISPELVTRCLTTDECDRLRDLPASQQQSRFFQLWTAKEAFLKATGRGLALDPKAIEIAFTRDNRPVLLRAEGESAPERWQYRCWQPAPGLCLALCTDHTLPDRLEFRETGWR